MRTLRMVTGVTGFAAIATGDQDLTVIPSAAAFYGDRDALSAQFAGDRLVRAPLRVDFRQLGDERLRVGMVRGAVDRVLGADLDL